MTQMVTEPVLINHLSNLHPNVIRFPGGSLSDVYFWNALPNVPPADAPDSLLDANGIKTPAGYWYGKNTAAWTASLDNYYNMLLQTGNKGMITVNYGYARYGKGPKPVAAAAHMAANWVRTIMEGRNTGKSAMKPMERGKRRLSHQHRRQPGWTTAGDHRQFIRTACKNIC